MTEFRFYLVHKLRCKGYTKLIRNHSNATLPPAIMPIELVNFFTCLRKVTR